MVVAQLGSHSHTLVWNFMSTVGWTWTESWDAIGARAGVCGKQVQRVFKDFEAWGVGAIEERWDTSGQRINLRGFQLANRVSVRFWPIEKALDFLRTARRIGRRAAREVHRKAKLKLLHVRALLMRGVALREAEPIARQEAERQFLRVDKKITPESEINSEKIKEGAFEENSPQIVSNSISDRSRLSLQGFFERRAQRKRE